MDELIAQPIAAIAAALKAKQITSVDLVKTFLDRIDAVNGELNAVIALNTDNALKYAAKADADLANGEHHGPLHGIPMTIKDSLDTRDIVTTWGTTGRKEFLPGRDATAVGRLRAAGAILLGKTNTPEFTLSFQTDNLLFGPTKNPFDPTRTPGGSSGGAAALIASGAALFDVGTDTGGSIRLPAHFSGITGIKPTTGRVPCTGNALPSSGLIARLSQPGPMARSVADLEFLLEIMAGPDLLDPNAIATPLGSSAAVDISALRFAYHTDNGIKTPEPDIIATVKRTVDLLIENGHDVTEARPSGIEMTNLILSRLFAADGGEMVEALLEDCRTTEPSPRIAAMLEAGSPEIHQQEFARIINLWDNFRGSMLSFFNDFDVLLCPVNGRTAIPLGEEEDMANYTYTSAFNLTGWPALVVRAGTDEQGLPIGIQVVAAPFREDHCFAVARWLESQLGEFSKPGIFCGKN
ncbi:MAG: amidase [Candidatus Azotimanducaceae bacterium]|jgi:amidase